MLRIQFQRAITHLKLHSQKIGGMLSRKTDDNLAVSSFMDERSITKRIGFYTYT